MDIMLYYVHFIVLSDSDEAVMSICNCICWMIFVCEQVLYVVSAVITQLQRFFITFTWCQEPNKV